MLCYPISSGTIISQTRNGLRLHQSPALLSSLPLPGNFQELLKKNYSDDNVFGVSQLPIEELPQHSNGWEIIVCNGRNSESFSVSSHRHRLTIAELEMLIKNNSKLSQLNKLSHCVGTIRELNLLQFSQAKKLTRKFETCF